MMMIDDCPVHFVHHHLLRVCKHIDTHRAGSSVCPDEDDDDDDNEADETYNDDDTDSDDSDDGDHFKEFLHWKGNPLVRLGNYSDSLCALRPTNDDLDDDIN